MFIQKVLNGKRLVNDSHQLAVDCGGYTCNCTLLTGDNSNCYDIDQTPSKYELDWDGVLYCLDYDSGDVWSKTIVIGGVTTVITLDLTFDDNTAKITVTVDSVLVFSGTKTGTSCVHRLEGSMTNTVSPSDWGTVDYYHTCSPAFSCDCTLLSGDNSSCYDTDCTPDTYRVDFGDLISFCLDYDTGNIWIKQYGELLVTLDLEYAAGSARLTIEQGEDLVYEGYYSGTSGIHRWSGSDLENEVTPSDWGNANYYPLCTQPDFDCDCSTTTDTNCTCFNPLPRPNTYTANFGNITYCLEWVSGCIWRKVSGSLTIEANINSSGATLLTIVDGSTTVFSGTLTGDCAFRKYGKITNSYDNDWGILSDDETYRYAVLLPRCSGDTCLSGRLVWVAISGLKNIKFAANNFGSPASELFLELLEDEIVFYGFTRAVSTTCYMRQEVLVNLSYKKYAESGCTLTESKTVNVFCEIYVTSSVWVVTISSEEGTYWEIFYGTVTQNSTEIGYGESFTMSNTRTLYTVNAGITCQSWDYTLSGGSTQAAVPGTATVTLY